MIGHDKQKEFFERAVKSGTLSHAYIFVGPEMIGKRKFSEELYKLANNRDGNLAVDPDLKIIAPKIEEGDTKIYIENSRDIKQFFSLTPYTGPYKFLIIDDADRLTPEASNAILKILEEPPKTSILILITSQPNSLLDTIRSRCNLIKFLPQTLAQIDEFLKSKKISFEDREFIKRITIGRLGRAMTILEKNQLTTIKKNIFELERVLKQGVFEKIQFAKIFCEKEDYKQVMADFIHYLSADVNNNNRHILKKLLELNNLLSQPQFNHRLAIENFLINAILS